jgi:hypothetical protein
MSYADAPAEWIAIIEEQIRIRIHKSFALDERYDGFFIAIGPVVPASKLAPQDTFLHPYLIFIKPSGGSQAGQFCTGPCTAWGTIVRFSRAKNEVSRVSATAAWSEKFNMIDIGIALHVDGGSNGPSDFGELFDVGKFEIEFQIID